MGVSSCAVSGPWALAFSAQALVRQMAKNTGETDLKGILFDPKVLFGNERLSDNTLLMLRETQQIPDGVLGVMILSRLKSLPPEDAAALCHGFAEVSTSGLIGSIIKRVVAERLKR